MATEASREDIQMFGAILNRMHLMLKDIFSNDSLSMTNKDISSALAGLDFGCIERIAKSSSKLSIILNDRKNRLIFTFFAKIQSNSSYNPPQIKNFIACSVAPLFKNIYNDSREIMCIEQRSMLQVLRKNSEFEEFFRKTA